MQRRAPLVPTLTSSLMLGVALAGGLTACDEDDEGGGFDGDTTVLPDDPADWEAWLEEKGYREWTGESASHPSDGPHPRLVQAFVNDTLAASLDAGNTHHPVGSVSIKEITDENNGKVVGWSVVAKLEETTDQTHSGNAFYWFNKVDGVVDMNQRDSDTCYGCHSGAFGEGQDFVMSVWPLQ